MRTSGDVAERAGDVYGIEVRRGRPDEALRFVGGVDLRRLDDLKGRAVVTFHPERAASRPVFVLHHRAQQGISGIAATAGDRPRLTSVHALRALSAHPHKQVITALFTTIGSE